MIRTRTRIKITLTIRTAVEKRTAMLTAIKTIIAIGTRITEKIAMVARAIPPYLTRLRRIPLLPLNPRHPQLRLLP
jgi:hypothetical protein